MIYSGDFLKRYQQPPRLFTSFSKVPTSPRNSGCRTVSFNLTRSPVPISFSVLTTLIWANLSSHTNHELFQAIERLWLTACPETVYQQSMTKECQFCGGKCGRVCRGLGFPRAVAEPVAAACLPSAGRTVGSIPATGAKVNDRDNRSGTRKAPKSPGRPADSRDVGAVDGKDKPSSAGTLNRSELARRTLPRRRESMPENVESRDQGRVDPSPPPKPKRKAAAFNKIAAGLTEALAFAKGESTGAVVHKTKTGRHLVEDRDKTIESQKPWIAAGMCRATWYSRRKAKRGEQ